MFCIYVFIQASPAKALGHLFGPSSSYVGGTPWRQDTYLGAT